MRRDRRVGGIYLLYNSLYRARKLESKEFSSFESMIVALKMGSSCIYLTGIYRLPYSSAHPVTFTVFMEEGEEFINSLLLDYTEFIIHGDFDVYVYVYDENNNNSNKFSNLLSTLAIHQQVHIPTHNTVIQLT